MLHVRDAFCCKYFLSSLPDDDVKFSYFVVMTTRSARESKCSIMLCLYMKTIRAKQAKVLFANFVQRDQHDKIGKLLT